MITGDLSKQAFTRYSGHEITFPYIQYDGSVTRRNAEELSESPIAKSRILLSRSVRVEYRTQPRM